MTIQLRLTLWYTALLGVTLILFSVLVYYALFTGFYAEVRRDAVTQADEVIQFIKPQFDAPQLFSSRIIISQESDVGPIVELMAIPEPRPNLLAGSGDVQLFNTANGKVYKHTKNVISSSVPVPPDALQTVRSDGEIFYSTTDKNGTPLLVYSLPLHTTQGTLGLQIIQSTAPIELALLQVSRYLILGTLLSLVLAALVGAYLARRALRPISTITQTASSISRTGDLGRRLSIPEKTSEVGQLATTFNEMLDRIQRLFKTQERLVADVSHELRTPITTVQGNIELLRRVADAKPATDASQAELVSEMLRDVLQEVEDETARMGRMISDLLLLAQADSGELTLQRDVVEMDTLLLDIYRQTKRIAQRSKGDGALDVRLGGEDQALVRGDRERLRQLLLNLAENAVKYTPSGGSITLGLVNEDGWVRVDVQDTGIGIDPMDQEHIFERFYRTDKARSREMGGSGLGLSIVQWIAKAHGGHVSVESQLQQGSTFTLWLPLWQAESTTEMVTSAPAERPSMA